MSYISGLALGLSAGKQIHQMLCNKEKEPVLQLAHAIDGRRRYYYKKISSKSNTRGKNNETIVNDSGDFIGKM